MRFMPAGTRLPHCSIPRYTVCDDTFSGTVARVACRQLGLPHRTALVLSNYVVGSGFGPIAKVFGCDGSEKSLEDCVYANATYCFHYEDVGLACAGAGAEDVGESRVSLLIGAAQMGHVAVRQCKFQWRGGGAAQDGCPGGAPGAR